MISEIIENEYPICDSDVWVYACFGNIVDRLFEIHKKIVIADVVEGEILKWKSNQKFKYVADKYEEYKNSGKILVISHEKHIPNEVRIIQEGMLREFGFRNYFANTPSEPDKGEYVSAIYADYFNICLFRTNDKLFAEDGLGRNDFPNLNIQDWNETIRCLVPNDMARLKINKMIEQEEKRCGYYKHKRKLSLSEDKFKQKKEKLDLVSQLRSRWS